MRALVLALALGLAVTGCASTASTEVRRPELYPDRASADSAWQSFLWAWREGDVDALQVLLGLWLKEELDAQLKQNGRTAVSDWWRRDAGALKIEAATWARRTDDLAYLDVRVRAPSGLTETRFSFLRRGDGWVVSGKRPLH